jgi:hypothetical protein
LQSIISQRLTSNLSSKTFPKTLLASTYRLHQSQSALEIFLKTQMNQNATLKQTENF